EPGTPGRYVTENHSFLRVEHLTGGSDYWRVLRPDGTRLYYGFDPGSDPLEGSVLSSVEVKATDPTTSNCSYPFINCPLRETIIAASIPFAWYLDRIEDRNGNVIRLVWDRLSAPGYRYLIAIEYSEHVSGAVNQLPNFGGPNDGSLTRTRSIDFSYDLTRTDFLPKYRTGFVQIIAYRLNQIDVTVDASLVRRYLLEYEQSPVSGRSRLTAVRERDASGLAGNDLVHTFTYGNGGDVGPGGTYWSLKDSRWDLPGSLAFLSAGADQGIRLIDVNTDGYPDVVRSKSGTRQTYLGGPGGFDTGANTTWKLPFDIVAGNGYRGVVFSDLDGDGRKDIFQRYITITGTNQHTEACGAGSENLHHEVVTGSQGSFTARRSEVNTGSGWAADASQDPGFTRFESDTVFADPGLASCPYEYMPTSDRVSGISAGFDQGMRVMDGNGDGRDDLLLLLTDTAGLHTADPAHDGSARLIERVERIEAFLETLPFELTGAHKALVEDDPAPGSSVDFS
ncbi:MAG: VCBS repeat-containing protein, partial [Gemmatimonadetes bacterium]|nr:VCBS repeat-containing protein [Gemmatimonadota bacterium]